MWWHQNMSLKYTSKYILKAPSSEVYWSETHLLMSKHMLQHLEMWVTVLSQDKNPVHRLSIEGLMEPIQEITSSVATTSLVGFHHLLNQELRFAFSVSENHLHVDIHCTTHWHLSMAVLHLCRCDPCKVGVWDQSWSKCQWQTKGLQWNTKRTSQQEPWWPQQHHASRQGSSRSQNHPNHREKH